METNLGIQIMEQLLTGTATPVPYDNGHARIAIGDGNGSVPTVHATDTALVATTNIVYLPMNAGFPNPPTGGVMTWQATAGPTIGNFAWREWGIDNGGSGNTPVVLFNHVGVNLGTKTAGTTWTFQASITQT